MNHSRFEKAAFALQYLGPQAQPYRPPEIGANLCGMRGPVGAGHRASSKRQRELVRAQALRALNEFAALGGLALGGLATLGCGALADQQSNERSDLGSTPAASLTAVSPTANPASVPSPAASTEESAPSASDGTVPYTTPTTSDSEVFVDVAPTGVAANEAPNIQTVTVAASEFAGDAGDCRMWLDSATSELRVVDLEVSHGEQIWPASSSCGDDTSWSLSSDLDGTWLELCPSLCDLVRASPETDLFISVKYYTAPPLAAR